MHFLQFAVAGLGFAVVTSAQTTHTVKVGENGLTFDPTTLVAANGDTVNFEFYAGTHSITQSTFADPCSSLDGGVDSGIISVAGTTTTRYSMLVNETTPLWFYCAEGAHCSNGMVFALNVDTTSANTYEAFLANAQGNTSGSTTSVAGTTASAASSASVVSASTSRLAATSTASTASRPAATTGTPNGVAAGSNGGVTIAVVMGLLGGLLAL